MGKIKGLEAFQHHYKEVHGERWDKLSQALLLEREHTSPEGLTQAYYLDAASLVPPKVLNPQPGEHVLDLCAAPGGKSLQLAVALKGQGRLVLNELSRTRRQRLDKVIKEHLPAEWQKNIEIWGKDGSTLGMTSLDRFDAILLDAPCSSERHLLMNPTEMALWSLNRSKQLAHRQMALLCSALDLLKPGGRLVYSTCAISPIENQLNVDKFLKKRGEKVEAQRWTSTSGEACGLGRLILPDENNGQGPMFTAFFIKKQTE